MNILQELEGDQAFRQAEHHYIEARDWKAAINMYRTQDLWDEAYRVSTHSMNWILQVTNSMNTLKVIKHFRYREEENKFYYALYIYVIKTTGTAQTS